MRASPTKRAASAAMVCWRRAAGWRRALRREMASAPSSIVASTAGRMLKLLRASLIDISRNLCRHRNVMAPSDLKWRPPINIARHSLQASVGAGLKSVALHRREPGGSLFLRAPQSRGGVAASRRAHSPASSEISASRGEANCVIRTL